MSGTISLKTPSGGVISLVPTNTATNFSVTVPAAAGTVITTGAPQSGGVIQVVSATYAVSVSSTSTSFVSTGLTATITPKFSNSKIFVIATTSARNSTGNNGILFTLFRGTVSGTNLGSASEGFGNFGTTGDLYSPITIQVLDSPTTVSATTYTLAMAVRSGTTGFAQNGNAPAQITLMEIAA